MLWNFAFLTPFNFQNLQGRFIIPLRVTPKNLKEPWSCLFCAGIFYGERFGTSATSGLGCFRDVWSSLVCLVFSPRLFFGCQLYYRVPGAIFRHHVNHNFFSYDQYFNFIFSPLWRCFQSATSCGWHGCRGTMVEAGDSERDICLPLSWNHGSFQFSQFSGDYTTVKPVDMEPWVVISAINFLFCAVYLCYPPWQVSLLSSSLWHLAGATRLLCNAVHKEWQIKMTGLSYKIGI